MARRAFFSFHYAADGWRVAQVRNCGSVEADQPVTDNAWETITRGGDAAIKRWIDQQLTGRSCLIVLIGRSTAKRKWVDYEIVEAWKRGKGVVGVYIHNLKDAGGNQSIKGANPFASFTLGRQQFSSIVKAYDPPYSNSASVYRHICTNMAKWVEEAITIRARYGS